jgi:anti-anti-sigma factor
MYVIKPSGILTKATSEPLLAEVQWCFDANVKTVLINLENVSFIDSYGLGILISIHTRLKLADRKLCLCSLNDQAKGLLDIADLDKTFEVYENQDDFYAVRL